MARPALVLVAMVLTVTCAQPATAAPRLRDADYWAFVERSFAAVDEWWTPEQAAYVVEGHRTAQVRHNAGLLLVHSIAALERHHGLARNDERARAIAERLTAPPVRRLTARAASRTVCWSASMHRLSSGHASIDPTIAEALAWAWRARRVLGLPASVTRGIVTQVDGCARHRYWSFPPAVATQINWNAELYGAAATVTGNDALLRGAYRRHLAWFANGITRRDRNHNTTNLGTGYAFRYLPAAPPSHPFNSDVPEYANIVVEFIGHYDRALRAGMRPLPARSITLLRAWIRRLLAGSWTHAGFLNWDTGYGTQRWMSGQYWAFAQQGLIAIASSPRLRSARDGRWAKAIFDRGLLLYRRLADETGSPLAPARLYGVTSGKEETGSYHVRMVVNAARAVALGLGRRPSEDPPPLYAYDPDTGRVAVTTPRYSTAVVPDNRGAFPYGGIELARLFGAGQRPAANIGGVPSSAFGIVVQDARGRTLLATQRVRADPLRVLRSPRGGISRPRRHPARPYAGPFRVLAVRGAVARNGVLVTSTHHFTRSAIRTRWDLRCPRSCRRGRLLFPTWGATATVDAVLRGGARVRLAGEGLDPYAEVRLSSVRRVQLGEGYALVPVRGPATATLHALTVRPQATNPDPGPTLAIELPGGSRLRHATVTVQLVPRRQPRPGSARAGQPASRRTAAGPRSR